MTISQDQDSGSDPHAGNNYSRKKLTFDEARGMRRQARRRALLDYNFTSEDMVTGVVRAGGAKSPFPFWVERLQTVDGADLEIPLDYQRHAPSVPLNGIPQEIKVGDRVKLRIDVVADDSAEIRVRNNLFSLVAVTQPELLTLVEINLVVRDGQKVLIPDSVLASELGRLQQPLTEKYESFKTNMDHDISSMLQEQAAMDEEVSRKKELLSKANEEYALSREQESHVKLQVEQLTRQAKILENQREEAMAAYQKMCDFALEKAEILHTLDLISEDQYEDLTGLRPELALDKDHLSWAEDIKENFTDAVSVIHAFLLEKGMIYPRWIISDFLTLLRTNDLVILSGLSGAGKTQLVSCFAEALGGVAHIVPVKPNWTGAEDLIGFFNPIQRTYVRTPFLEAILAAKADPQRLHLICLDEMNLARAEYYFADFFSALEDRSKAAEIALYSESEASHIQAEVRMLLASLNNGNSLFQPSSLEALMSDPACMQNMRQVFGEAAGEGFSAFHGRVRRSLSTILDVPTTIIVPANVRFVGAINIDQTTYGLSPKILDRAHVIRFANPLKYPAATIAEEARSLIDGRFTVGPIYMPPDALVPQRTEYPKFELNHPATEWLLQLYEDFLEPLGIEMAYRTMRQSQLFWDLICEIDDLPQVELSERAKCLIFLQKILPKFTMDGKTKVRVGDETVPKMRYEIVQLLEEEFRAKGVVSKRFPSMLNELHRVRLASDSSDKIFNYWA